MSQRNPCTDARRTETCVAPRHVDTLRDFYVISPDKQRGEAARLFLSSSLFLCCGIGHRFKLFFQVGNQYAESEKQHQTIETVVRTQRHRLDADKFPMFSVGWTWNGFCRDSDPFWSEERAVTMM